MKRLLMLIVVLVASTAWAQVPNAPTMDHHAKKTVTKKKLATATCTSPTHSGSLAWVAPVGGTVPIGYNVYRTTTTGACTTTAGTGGICPSPSANTACTKSGSTTAPTVTFTDGGLTASTTYFWTVTATAAAGEGCSSAQATGTTCADPVPSAPTGLTVTAQ